MDDEKFWKEFRAEMERRNEKLFDKSVSPIAYQIGHIYRGHRITRRKKIPKWKVGLSGGNYWKWYAVPVRWTPAPYEGI